MSGKLILETYIENFLSPHLSDLIPDPLLVYCYQLLVAVNHLLLSFDLGNDLLLDG